MELNKFDAEQIERAVAVLEICGIEPTTETMQALAETAALHYPNEPDSLVKATQSMADFFTGSAVPSAKPEGSWERLRQWAFSVLRLRF